MMDWYFDFYQSALDFWGAHPGTLLAVFAGYVVIYVFISYRRWH